MKFIWLITIFLICLSLCFYFLRCNTSLLAQPAFIQCLADSHFGQREDSHKTPHQTEPCRQSQKPKARQARGASFQGTGLLLLLPTRSPSLIPLPAATAHPGAAPQRAGALPRAPRLSQMCATLSSSKVGFKAEKNQGVMKPSWLAALTATPEPCCSCSRSRLSPGSGAALCLPWG